MIRGLFGIAIYFVRDALTDLFYWTYCKSHPHQLTYSEKNRRCIVTIFRNHGFELIILRINHIYVELRITAEYGNKQDFVERLRHEIGLNAVTAEAAVQKTWLQSDAFEVIPTVVAAEQIQHKATILYFLEGSDTIVVHVAARTVGEAKQQVVRVARRTCKLFEKPSVKTSTKAVIYAVNRDFDTAIISGHRIGYWRRFIDAFTERWLARIVTPVIVFGGAAAYVPGTTLFQSALIGFFAAAIALVIESIVFAAKAEDWKWGEMKNDE